MKKKNENMQKLRNSSSMLMMCMVCMVFFITACYFGINSFKPTYAEEETVTKDTVVTITFKNGTTTVATESCTIKAGETSCSITPPSTVSTDSQHTFTGWGSTNGCSNGSTNSISATKDNTYYACFVASNLSCDYSFSMLDGTGYVHIKPDAPTDYTAEQCCNNISSSGWAFTTENLGTCSQKITTITGGTSYSASSKAWCASDYEFANDKCVSCTGNYVFDSSTATCTLPKYTVTFKDGSTVLGSSQCTISTTSTSCSVSTPYVTPTKDGYTFTGYGGSNGCTSGTVAADATSVTTSANKTYYACWVADSSSDSSSSGSSSSGNTSSGSTSSGSSSSGSTSSGSSSSGSTSSGSTSSGSTSSGSTSSGSSSISGSSSSTSSSSNTNTNTVSNPETGGTLMAIVWIIGLLAIGYSVWYIRSIKKED